MMLLVLFLLVIASWSLPSSALAVEWAYVPNSGSDDVTLIDITTNTVTATVPVGRDPSGVAVHPSGNRAYVANSGDNTVSVVEAATARVIATIPVGTSPFAVAMHPTGDLAYVTVSEGLLVIDTTTNTFASLVPISGARAVAVNPSGTRAYVTHVSRELFAFCDQLSVVDISGQNPIATITFACNPEGSFYSPFGVAVHPTGTAVYVTFRDTSALGIIDATTNRWSILDTVGVGLRPIGVAVHPSGGFAYVANEGSNTVSVVDTINRDVIATIPVGTAPWGVALNAAGTRAYVANRSANTVSVIDTATNGLATTIVVGSQPVAIGQFVGADDGHPSGASCAAELDAARYTDGQTARVSTFRLANPGGGPDWVELKAWLEIPGAAPVSFVNVGAAAFQPGLDVELGPFDLFTVGGDTRRGGYQLGCRAVHPVTGDLISQDLNPFEVSSAPAGLGVVTAATARPAEKAVASTPYAYVTNSGNDTVSVIDTGTDRVILTVPVGRVPRAVGVHPRGAAAYAGNVTDRTVSVLDTNVTIPVDSIPSAVVVHPSGTTVYAAGENVISLIDTASNAVIETVSLTDADLISSLAMDSTGERLYALAFETRLGSHGVVVAIDTTTNTPVGRIEIVGTVHTGLAVHPAGTPVYAANNNILYMIDAATLTVVGEVEVPFYPRDVGVHPAGTFVYVIGDRELTVIDAVTMTVSARVPGAGQGVATHPLGTRVYVTRNSGRVDVIETATHTIVAGIPVGDAPSDIAVGPPIPLRSLPPFCEVTLTKTEYVTGDAVVASSIRFANPSPFFSKAIEAKVWVEVPRVGPLSVLNAGTDSALRLAPGAELALGPVTLFTVGPTAILGDYHLNCRILDPVTAARAAQELNQFSIR